MLSLTVLVVQQTFITREIPTAGVGACLLSFSLLDQLPNAGILCPIWTRIPLWPFIIVVIIIIKIIILG